mmetsp:Transcript_16979/g.47008  ORF Transcript_16979/g.47008 Transcript_16979/m.47008 type:complete len:357 (+) Transcript_16979:308-1378(+)
MTATMTCCKLEGTCRCRLRPHEVLDELALAVEQFKVEREEVVGKTVRRVDLDTSHEGDAAVALHGAASLIDDVVHHFSLRVVKRVGQLDVAIIGGEETLGVGRELSIDVGLLRVEGVRGRQWLAILHGWHLSLADLSERGGGATAARTTLGTSTAVDGSDAAVGVDADVGSEDDEARTAVGDVMGHGAEAGDAAERESCEAAHDEWLVVDLGEVLLERSVDLVTAQGGGDQTVLSVSVLGEALRDALDELGVWQGVGECHGDLGLWDRQSLAESTAERDAGTKSNSEESGQGKGVHAELSELATVHVALGSKRGTCQLHRLSEAVLGSCEGGDGGRRLGAVGVGERGRRDDVSVAQ